MKIAIVLFLIVVLIILFFLIVLGLALRSKEYVIYLIEQTNFSEEQLERLNTLVGFAIKYLHPKILIFLFMLILINIALIIKNN